MAYYYDMLVEALGGKSLTTNAGNGNKTWSPNMYKRVIMGYDAIIVERHGTRSDRFTRRAIDTSKLTEELADYQVKGKQPANLLKVFWQFKAFSCLEEIVIHPTLLTEEYLHQFLNKMNDNWRMRAVTYAEGPATKTAEYATKLPEGGLVADISPTKYIIDKKGDYYNRYLLRPEYYPLDSKDGALRRYFDRIKEENESKQASQNVVFSATKRYEFDRDNTIPEMGLLLDFLRNTKEDKELSPLRGIINQSLKPKMQEVGSLKLLVNKGIIKQDSHEFKLYDAFGYFADTKGGAKTTGYFPKVSAVAGMCKTEITNLVRKGILSKEGIKKGASDKELLFWALGQLKGGLIQVESSDVKLKQEEKTYSNITGSLTKEDCLAIIECLNSMKESYKNIFGVAMAYKLTEQEGTPRLKKNSLSKEDSVYSEMLDLLGYTSKDGVSPSEYVMPDFMSKMRELSRLSAKNTDLVTQPWKNMSIPQMADYIIENFNRR